MGYGSGVQIEVPLKNFPAGLEIVDVDLYGLDHTGVVRVFPAERSEHGYFVVSETADGLKALLAIHDFHLALEIPHPAGVVEVEYPSQH